MKRSLLILLFCSSFHFTFAQVDTTQDKDVIFHKVDQEATFPGGMTAWRVYLQRNLNTSLADSCMALKKGMKTFRQTVTVSFIVDKEGVISNVVAENEKDICHLIAAEAVRVIKKGPKWMPAVQDNRKVIYRQRQNITWVSVE